MEESERSSLPKNGFAIVSAMKKLAILDDYQNVALSLVDWSSLRGRVAIDTFNDHLDDRDAIAARLRPYQIIVAMRERTSFDQQLISKLPNLELLVTTGPRNRAIDVRACEERGIVVSATRGAPGTTVELTWGLILALLRHIATEDRAMRQGKWQTTVGESLDGKVLGVIGLGRIGSRVAKIAKEFGMHVLAWSPNLTRERASTVGAIGVNLDELLIQADIVTLHLVLSETTHGLIGEREFALMKPSSVLINTARGGLVDEAALIRALQSQRIAGAGLDTYVTEPLPHTHPLLALSNTILTPHLGYVVRSAYVMYYNDVLEDIEAWFRGRPIRVLEPD